MNRVPERRGHGAPKPRETATKIVSAGRDPTAQHGFVNTPIYRGSTVLYPTAQDFLVRKARYTCGTKVTSCRSRRLMRRRMPCSMR